MKNKFLILSLTLTALLLAGCQSDAQPTGDDSPSPEQSEPVSPSQNESASPEQSESESPEPSESGEEAPAEVADQPVFTPGTWLGVAPDGNQQYYFFNPDGTSGSTSNLEYGIGVAFEYEIEEDGRVLFHMGAVDVDNYCTVEAADAEHLTLQWDDGSVEELSYASTLGAGEFTFYSERELCDLAVAYYRQNSGEETGELAAGSAVNDDGTITIQVYESLGDHNSTAAWYKVDRFTAQGTDENTGEAVDLSTVKEMLE